MTQRRQTLRLEPFIGNVDAVDLRDEVRGGRHAYRDSALLSDGVEVPVSGFTVEPSTFGFRGRLSLSRFWLLGLVFVFWLPLIAQFILLVFARYMEDWFLVAEGLLCSGVLITFFSLFIRRLRDLNLSAWYALAWVIPFVGALLALYTAIMPGSKVDNKFGPPNLQLKLFAIIFTLLSLLLTGGAVIYLEQGYDRVFFEQLIMRLDQVSFLHM